MGSQVGVRDPRRVWVLSSEIQGPILELGGPGRVKRLWAGLRKSKSPRWGLGVLEARESGGPHRNSELGFRIWTPRGRLYRALLSRWACVLGQGGS